MVPVDGLRTLRSHPLLLAIAGVAVVALVAGVACGVVLRTSHADVVLAAAGDIACDPVNPAFHGGRGSARACHQRSTSDLLAKINPRDVLVLGDVQYVHGSADKYAASYTPTWGRYLSKTRPVIGNHEGGEGGSSNSYFDYFGARAGPLDKGYYSFDVGSWHVVALNSNCGTYSFNGSNNGCAAGSPQERWLKADLAAHRPACTLAYFHVPRFTSSKLHHSDAASNRTLTALWNDMYAAGVDLILNGHSHHYERFAPLTPQGAVDRQRGIREFVVGTGGDNLQAFGPTVQGSEVRRNDSFGVLELTLKKRSYDWQFVNDATSGSSNADQGSAACH